MAKLSAKARKKLESARKSGAATQLEIKLLEDDVETLDAIETTPTFMMDSVDEYAEKLIETGVEKRSPQESLWLMAFDYAQSAMNTGTMTATKDFTDIFLPTLFRKLPGRTT